MQKTTKKETDKKARLLILVLHGYNRGTALKEMILYKLDAPRLIGKHGVKGNYGRTILQIAAA